MQLTMFETKFAVRLIECQRNSPRRYSKELYTKILIFDPRLPHQFSTVARPAVTFWTKHLMRRVYDRAEQVLVAEVLCDD